jgi:hypothetical protein
MTFTFDPDKSARNAAGRGLPFDLVERLEWESALVLEDTRKDYGETASKCWRSWTGVCTWPS